MSEMDVTDPSEGQRIRRMDSLGGGCDCGTKTGGKRGGGSGSKSEGNVVAVVGSEEGGSGIKMKDPMPVDKISAIR